MNQSQKNSGHQRPIVVGTVVALLCLLVTGGYAYARYVYFGPVVESKIPLYISNKAISWSSVLLIAGSFAMGPLARITPRCQSLLGYRQALGLIGLWLATLHILVSLPILNMLYYVSFFNLDGTLKATSELSMLAGAVAWMLLLPPAVVSLSSIAAAIPAVTWQRMQRLGLLALIVTFGHVAWLGWKGWFEPETWYGGLPPITLLSCAVILVLVLLRGVASLAGDEKR